MAEPSNNQMAFWEAMKEKYERRNESLKYQEACLKKRLEQLRVIMEKQKIGDDCDCVPEKLEKPGLVQCLVQKGKNLILGGCKCVDSKVGGNFLCACHIEDPNAPINVDPNLCPNQEPAPPEGCLNPTCDFYDPTLAHLDENPSTFSLKMTDIYYMDKLADLVKSEKNMQDKIEDLEKREHSYLAAIRDLQEAMKKQPKTESMNKEFKKISEALEEENKKLRNELDDLRLELKHCFERVEGPLRRSLQVQQDKCTHLENQLKDLQAKTKLKEDSYSKEINEVKAKLCKACCTMVDLNNVNSKLKVDLQTLQNKCANLEDELLRQQMKEAENILKFKSVLASRRRAGKKIQAEGDQSGGELARIAKNLGDTLKEVCPGVSNIPSGLTETAENIKELTEMVLEKGSQQRKKRKKMKQSSRSAGSDTIDRVKSKKVEDCSCSNSSLKLQPKIGGSKFSDKRIGNSPRDGSLTTRIGVPKKTSTPKRAVKKTSSKSCTCCPALKDCDNRNQQQESIETVCGASDAGNKKIGPSEEVIAVKNLGTLSTPTEVTMACVSTYDPNFTKTRTEKLAVDTTVDVLDVPPKDIHLVTTIAKSGSLEITTEGPPGVVHTKVNYLPDGKIEIVTKLIDRNNMDDFLDGTLLQVPEGPPDCDQSQTCGGHCDLGALPPCPETDCDDSKTCGGTCSENADGSKYKKAKENADSTYGRVVVNNLALLGFQGNNPFLPKEWKNSNFDADFKEEVSHQNMIIACKYRSKPQERSAVHGDVDSVNELLKLSSRQSLTEIDSSQKDQEQKTSCFVHKDVLDTIREVDEHIDSSKHDHGDLAVEKVNDILEISIDINSSEIHKESIKKIERIEDASVPELKEIQFISASTSTNLLETFSPTSNLYSDKIRGLASAPSSTTEDVDSIGSKSEINTEVPTKDKDDENQVSYHLLTQAENSSSLREIKKIPTNFKFTESSYKLSGNFNLTNGNVTLKQSKSMYERRGNVSEYLRICKSSSLSLGSLKVDLETFKLSTRHPTVGDSTVTRLENRKLLSMEDLKLLSLSSNVVNKISCFDERMKLSDFLGEVTGADRNYQCYVCCCSKKKENEQDASVRPVNNRDLEQRIDRLLEINPLSSSHGQNCHCERCRMKIRDKTKTKQDNRSCSCSRNSQNKKDQPAHMSKKEKGNEDDTFLHDPNCTCVDCICSPCNFKKGDNNLTVSGTQEMTVMEIVESSDHEEKLKSEPYGSEGEKTKHGSCRKTRKPPCKKCYSKNLPYSDVPVTTLPDTWKSVVDVKSAETNHGNMRGAKVEEHTTEKIDAEPPTLELQEERKRCACLPDCSCNACPADAKGDVGDGKKTGTGTPDSEKSCLCLPKCKCDPCVEKLFRERMKKEETLMFTKHISFHENTEQELNIKMKEKYMRDIKSFLENCACPTCSCDPCPLLAGKEHKKEKEKGVVSDKKEVGKEKVVPDKEEVAKEDVVPDKITLDSTKESCACRPSCSCAPCPKLAEKEQEKKAEKKDEIPDKSKQGSKSETCGCRPKCACARCPVGAKGTGDSVGSKCDCKICQCDICFKSHSLAAENFESKYKPIKEKNQNMNSAKKKPCDCRTCECDICMSKIVETPINAGDSSEGKSGGPKRDKDKEIVKMVKGKEEGNAQTDFKCDCCACVPCKDPTMKKERPISIGDADRAREELKDVLNKIGCTCDQAEENLKPLVKPNFETTVCHMKTKLNNLQQKCNDKDQIISAMTKELRMRSESGVFADLLHDLSHPKQRVMPDFTRTYICDALPKPKQMMVCNKSPPRRCSLTRFGNRLEPILELDRYLPGSKEICPCPMSVSGLEIIDIRRVTVDSILMKWKGPVCPNGITGYQIFINDQLKYRVLSPNRTSAVIDSLDLSSSLEVMVYAMTNYGRCEPPALATYKI